MSSINVPKVLAVAMEHNRRGNFQKALKLTLEVLEGEALDPMLRCEAIARAAYAAARLQKEELVDELRTEFDAHSDVLPADHWIREQMDNLPSATS